MKKGFILGLVGLAAAAVVTTTVVTLMPPPGEHNNALSEQAGDMEMELSDNMSDAIRNVMDVLGPAPDNVVGFGMGFKRPAGTSITAEENSVLLRSFRTGSGIFSSDERDRKSVV